MAILSVFPSDFDREGVSAVWGIDLFKASDILSEFVRWSLVNYALIGDRYRLHDIVRSYTSSLLDRTPNVRIMAEKKCAEY